MSTSLGRGVPFGRGRDGGGEEVDGEMTGHWRKS